MTPRPAARARYSLRRRVAAAIAGAGLIGLAAFGGALSAQALSQPPTVDPIPGIYPAFTPLSVSGTLSENREVLVQGTVQGDPITYLGCATGMLPPGTWNCNPQFQPGIWDVWAYADTLPAGDPSADSNHQAITVYGTDAVAFTSSPGTLTTDSTPTLSGTGPAMGTVDVRDGSPTPVCSSPVAPDGTWSCTTVALPLGPHTLNARGIDMASGVTFADSAPFTLQAPIAPTIDQSFGPPWVSDIVNPGISGTKEADVTSVEIRASQDGGFTSSIYCSMSALDPAATTWSCPTPNGASLEHGTNELRATGTASNGAVTLSSAPITIQQVDAATVTYPADGSTINVANPVFGGTSEGTSIQVVDTIGAPPGGSLYCGPAPITGGTWSCAYPGNIGNGTTFQFRLLVSPGELLSPIYSFTVDTLAPAAPVLTAPTGTTYDTTPTITGTGEAGATVTVYVDAGVIGCDASTVVDTGGNWSCTPTVPLSAAAHSAAASLTDPVGNEGPTSAALGFTVSNVPPPAVDYGLAPGTIGVTVTGLPGGQVRSPLYRAVPSESGYAYPGGVQDGCPTPLSDGEGGYFVTFGAQVEACTYSGLDPAIWNVYSDQRVGAETSVALDDYILIPAAPTLTTSTEASIVTFSGTGEPGYIVRVQNSTFDVACVRTVPLSGSWSCPTVVPAGSQWHASQQSQGFVAAVSGPNVRSFDGFSPVTASVIVAASLPTLSVPTPTPTPTPSATPKAPLVWSFTIGGDGKTEYAPGDTVALTGDGLPQAATVDAELHSTPIHLGATVVSSDGSFILPVTIPSDVEPGKHNFVVTVTEPGEAPSVVSQPVTIVALGDVKSQSESPAKTGDPSSEGGAVGEARNDPAAPSSFTHSIDTFQQILSNPGVIAAAGAAGLALLLFVAFPAELLNSTISEQYPRFAKRLPKVRTPWLTRFTDWLESTPIFGGIAITLLAAVIFAFADPGVGFDITSLRVVMACAIALFIVGFIASSIAGRIIGARWQLPTVMELKPLGLILTVVGVVLSRLLEFSPGFLLGLLLGIGLVGRTTAAQRAKATLVQAGVVFVLAVLGWVGYSVLAATGAGGDFGSALALDTMVAITSEGLTALFIGLLPFRFLDGSSIFEHSKVLWAAAYAVAAAAFVLIVLPASWGELSGSLWVWIAIVGAFALVALGIYLYFRFWAPPLEEDEEEPAAELVDSH